VELEAASWEQGPASLEEQRKVDPALGTPFRPLTGHGLGIGRTTSAIPAEALEAISDTTGVAVDVAGPASAEAVASAAALAGTSTEASSVAAPAAGEVPAGAVRGDGLIDCPPEFPIKGNAQSKIYHAPESRVYGQTIAEFCFATAEAAQAAGYRPPKNL
jgi:large subunit ribosomal protein L17